MGLDALAVVLLGGVAGRGERLRELAGARSLVGL
jgi:hypothetical protein